MNHPAAFTIASEGPPNDEPTTEQKLGPVSPAASTAPPRTTRTDSAQSVPQTTTGASFDPTSFDGSGISGISTVKIEDHAPMMNPAPSRTISPRSATPYDAASVPHSSVSTTSSGNNASRGPSVSAGMNIHSSSASTSPDAIPLTSGPLNSGLSEVVVVSTNAPVQTCKSCGGAIPVPLPSIFCLVCATAERPCLIPKLCLHCYTTSASFAGHSHHPSYYCNSSDVIVQDTQLSQQSWTVHRNSSQRLWYEHRQTGYKTHLRPMTAIYGSLPPGWIQKKDPEGNVYYENSDSGQMTRLRPQNSLPPGWRETRDPDGKVFFVQDALQLASWCRPGEQPPLEQQQQLRRSSQAQIGYRQATGTIALASNPSSDNAITKPHPGRVTRKSLPAASGQSTTAVSIAAGSSQQQLVRQSTSQEKVTFGGAVQASVNLVDPSSGGIVRNTKIAAHITADGMRGTAKAIKQNKRLKKFARGTGITHVNKQVKKAWRNAAIQVDVATNAKFQGEVKIAQSGQALVLEDADDGYDGGYVVEYEDGSVEVIGGNQSDGRSKVDTQQTPALPRRPSSQLQLQYNHQAGRSSQLTHQAEHHMQQAQMTYRSGAQPQSTTSLVHGGTQAQQGVQIAYQSGNQTQLTGQFAYQGQQHTQQVAQVEYQSGQAAGVAGQFTYHNEQQQHAAQLAFRSSQPEDQKPQATDRQQSSSPNSLTANLQLSLGGSGSAEKSQGQLQSNAAIPHQQRSVQSYNRPRSGSSSSGSSIDASELGARDSASVRGAYVGTGGNGYVGYGHSAQADQQQPVYVNMGPQIYVDQSQEICVDQSHEVYVDNSRETYVDESQSIVVDQSQEIGQSVDIDYR